MYIRWENQNKALAFSWVILIQVSNSNSHPTFDLSDIQKTKEDATMI
jgi:hypothetical protein